MDKLHPDTAWNAVKVLEKAGCTVTYNTEQTCCGQPAFNAGFWDEAKEVGNKFLKTFSEDSVIITPSASCTGMDKNYYNDLITNTTLHFFCCSFLGFFFVFSVFFVF